VAVVRWSNQATIDFESVSGFLGSVSPRLAEYFVRRVRQATQQLEMFPYSGQAVQAFDLESIRQLVLGSVRLTYLVFSEDEVIVMGIRAGPRRSP
jgi:plasmid stabilization system protein ParE